MNNNAENDFFRFPKVKWLHLTGEVDRYPQNGGCFMTIDSVTSLHLVYG